jgi:UDP-N-acetylglucosamine 4,6-dehydratase/5-epimerase
MLSKTIVTNLFQNKRFLVTGGLGSIGSEIVRQLLQYNPKQVRIVDNRETELFYARRFFKSNPNVEFFLGDVRDKERLNKAVDEIDIIFHTAALKHVLVCECDPVEAVKTNVIGTQNVVECAFEQNVERMILISTDKVVNPTNVMGATKLLAERLVSAMCNAKGDKKTKFGIVRFGNVLASRGSVLEIWERQLKGEKRITITHPDMTRFFMSIPDSVDLVFRATCYADNGETFILRMPSIRIRDLAEVFLVSRGFSKDFYEITGMAAGEKMHEGLLFEEETGFLMSDEEMFIRLPLGFDPDQGMNKFKKMGFTKSTINSFSSKEERYLLGKEKIEKVLSQIKLE